MLVHAVGLDSRDQALLQNQDGAADYGPQLGSHAAGTVLRAGPHAALRPGDRIFATYTCGTFCSHLRISSSSLARLPDDLSMADVCWTVPLLAATYHALVEIGHVTSQDRVLVDRGAGGGGSSGSVAGLAAVGLVLEHCGVTDVWVTAACEVERDWIVNHRIPGMSRECIFPREWFSTPAAAMTAKTETRNFNLVISLDNNNSTSSDLLAGCIRPGGKYVVVQQARRRGVAPSYHTPSSTIVNPMLLDVSVLRVQEDGLAVSTCSLGFAAGAAARTLLARVGSRPNTLQFAASKLADAFSSLRNKLDWGEGALVVEFPRHLTNRSIQVRVSSAQKTV